MKILVAAGHRYPARTGAMASDRIADCLAKGLAELGHRVIYKLELGASEPLPADIELVYDRQYDVDVMCLGDCLHLDSQETRGIPWVTTFHSPRKKDQALPYIRDNWIFVSKTHAQSYGRNRYVTNGIDPSEFVFSETKDDYFLFVVANLSDLKLKGFEIARSLVRECGIKLIVAGAPPEGESEEHYIQWFKNDGILYIGHVSGNRKAELFAGAKCLLFPTQANETFGLVVAEALMSGTPVISSNNGACPEIIIPEAGIICATMDDYKSALENIDRISPLACRTVALERFHYLRMARDYVIEFEKEIASRPTGRVQWVELDRRGHHFNVGVPRRPNQEPASEKVP
jgi:glycosyltransferase involved in cell wall biosynthesis